MPRPGIPKLPAALARFLADPRAKIEVGAIGMAVRQVLGTEVSAVLLSDETLAKQRENHRDLVEDDYALLPELLTNPTVVLQQDANHVLLLRRSGRVWVGVVKATRDRTENYLQSFRITNPADLKTLLRRHGIRLGDANDLELE